MDKTLGDQSLEEVHEKDGGEMSRKQPGELAHVVSQEGKVASSQTEQALGK